MKPQITIRRDELADDTEVLLHFGNGDQRSVETVAKQVADRHDFWFGVIDDVGRFAVSVYSLTGISEEVIAKEMPHQMYGRSTVGQVRSAGFELVASTVEMERMPAGLRRIQPWHSTVFLRVEGFPREVDTKTSDHMDRVQSELKILFSLFERVPNRWSSRSPS